jgi:hypothetical protein
VHAGLTAASRSCTLTADIIRIVDPRIVNRADGCLPG